MMRRHLILSILMVAIIIFAGVTLGVKGWCERGQLPLLVSKDLYSTVGRVEAEFGAPDERFIVTRAELSADVSDRLQSIVDERSRQSVLDTSSADRFQLSVWKSRCPFAFESTRLIVISEAGRDDVISLRTERILG